MAYRNGKLAGAFILIACGISATVSAQATLRQLPAIAPAGSLYARLGGTPVVTAFVADTIDKVPANPQMDRSSLKDTLTTQICALTGGGCAYRDDMHDVQLPGLVEVLRESMRAREVPLAARNQLLEILAPMNRDIVKR
jgi:hypothetical protein